jgi:hypothetical protein
MQVIADFDGSAADAPVGVPFLEMTARVVDDVPIVSVFFDIVGQQSLREVSPYRRSSP